MRDFESMEDRLKFIYGEAKTPAILSGIQNIMERHGGTISPRRCGWSERDSFLITYADSILEEGKAPLESLHQFLQSNVAGLLSFVHLLPFYPYTSDDGFSVTDFRTVREDLGTWDDIENLANDYRVVFDGVVNHVSASSRYMKRYASGDPDFRDFFLALDPATDTSSVLRTRNLPLLHEYPTHEGSKWLWTTFSQDQLDLNYQNPNVLLEMIDVLLFYAQKGASMIRLDAVPYLWKELGTSCAHLPQTHELIKLFRDVLDVAAPHVLLLTETNVPHHENLTYFGDHGDEAQMIYNFALAPLILWSLVKGNASTLTGWASDLKFVGPSATYLNLTATHDGIGMRPTEGILSEAERMELVQLARDHGGGMTGKRNADGSVSPYELNLNYFDAINDPRSAEPTDLQVRRFMVSQAIPMSLIGMPGIYIHSLFGSRNDYEGVLRSGRDRSINREQLRAERLRTELNDPASVRHLVFEQYRTLLRLRREQSAFHPDASQEILDLGPAVFGVKRENATTGQIVIALHNVTDHSVKVSCPGIFLDILSNERTSGGEACLVPYQVRWLTNLPADSSSMTSR